MIRCDRRFALVNRRRGGGVFVALSNKIPSITIDTSTITSAIPTVDIAACKCTLYNSTFYVIGLYIPPNISQHDFELFCDSFEAFLVDKSVIIIGDFNLPHFITDPLTCSKCITFSCLCNMFSLKQYNSIVNCDERLLDLVLTNIKSGITVERDDFPFVSVDQYHPALCVALTIPKSVSSLSSFPSNSNARYNFRRANFPQLYADLTNCDWSFLTEIKDVNLALDKFYESVYRIFDLNVPKVYATCNKSDYPKWFTTEIISNIKIKSYYRRKWNSTKHLYFLNEFKRLRALCKSQISVAYHNYMQSVQGSISRDPKLIFQYIRDKQGCTRIPNVLTYNNIVLDTPQDIVNAFADKFCSTYHSSTSFTNTNLSNNLPIVLPLITEDELINIMSSLPDNNISGDDLIPSFLLRDTRIVFAKPLAIIINLSIKTSTFPKLWQRTRVSPIFKKGAKAEINNYRPISILSNFAKVFENFLYHHLYNNLQSLISPHQHGFVRGRSTVSNLVNITQFICQELDRRGQVDVIYTDFSSAFDSIDHGVLLQKLCCLGLTTSLLKLIESYLCNRSNYVHYNGFKSFEFFPSSGVPQGSNLGPLLFILYINDLLQSFSCPVLAYADDIKIYTSITNLADVLVLQNNINYMADWCAKHNLKLNINKCCFVSYTRKVDPILTAYLMDNDVLQKVESVQDLGVLFDHSMSFAPHIANLCLSASKTLGFLIRSCKSFRNSELLKKLYFSFVVSKLEYASQVWSPRYVYLQLSLEKVQRRFLKYLSFKADGVYPQQGTDYITLLDRHAVESLTCRRECHGARFIWKLVHGAIDNPFLLASLNFRIPRLSSRSSSSFALPFSRTNLLQASPLSIMCRSADLHYDDIFYNKINI